MATTDHRNASSTPSWILFDSEANIVHHTDYNYTTALAWKNSKPIVVTLCPAHRPIPSRLIVHYKSLNPDEFFLQKPCIVCTAEGFLLIRIATGCGTPGSTIWSRTRGVKQDMCDYLIYKATGRRGPELKMLPNPHPRFFRDYEVGLHSDGDDHFTVAALSSTTTGTEFELHLFKSKEWKWTTLNVLLELPQDPFLVPIPDNAYRLLHHVTSTVITLGGAGGTIGWVDLWRGILLCDVLSDNPTLRGVPMPPPMPERLSDPDEGLECCPKPYRGIAVINNCLKVVELQVCGDQLPYYDSETDGPDFKILNWTLTTYTNSKITTTNDWEIDCTVEASDISIDEAVDSEMLRCGLLLKAHTNEDAGRNLQNLHTCQPVLCPDDEGIVYLITRSKFLHPKAWVLAVNMRKKRVQAMASIETERSLDSSLAFFPSRISSYISAAVPVVGNLS